MTLMDETHIVPEPVEFKQLKPRREYAQQLAQAAHRIRELETAAFTDSLTGLPNRRVFETELPKLFKEAKSQNVPLALMLLDINGVKRTNDTEGHWRGDELIKAAPKALTVIVRPDDIIGRLGGDEYYAILVGYEPLPGQTLEELNAEREIQIQENFAAATRQIGISEDLHVGITVGISVMQPDDTLSSFAKRADANLINKKRGTYKSLEEQGITFEDSRMSEVQS